MGIGVTKSSIAQIKKVLLAKLKIFLKDDKIALHFVIKRQKSSRQTLLYLKSVSMELGIVSKKSWTS